MFLKLPNSLHPTIKRLLDLEIPASDVRRRYGFPLPTTVAAELASKVLSLLDKRFGNTNVSMLPRAGMIPISWDGGFRLNLKKDGVEVELSIYNRGEIMVFRDDRITWIDASAHNWSDRLEWALPKPKRTQEDAAAPKRRANKILKRPRPP